MDTLGNLLALLVSPANEQERAQVGELAERVQQATDESVEIAFVDQGYTGDRPAEEAEAHGMRLEVVKHEGRSGASYSYHVGGWWNAISHGHRVSGDW